MKMSKFCSCFNYLFLIVDFFVKEKLRNPDIKGYVLYKISMTSILKSDVAR